MSKKLSYTHGHPLDIAGENIQPASIRNGAGLLSRSGHGETTSQGIIAGTYLGLEEAYCLPSQLHASHPPQKLFRFPRKHTTSNHFYPPPL